MVYVFLYWKVIVWFQRRNIKENRGNRSNGTIDSKEDQNKQDNNKKEECVLEEVTKQ